SARPSSHPRCTRSLSWSTTVARRRKRKARRFPRAGFSLARASEAKSAAFCVLRTRPGGILAVSPPTTRDALASAFQAVAAAARTVARTHVCATTRGGTVRLLAVIPGRAVCMRPTRRAQSALQRPEDFPATQVFAERGDDLVDTILAAIPSWPGTICLPKACPGLMDVAIATCGAHLAAARTTPVPIAILPAAA